jgi:hypothetical protein
MGFIANCSAERGGFAIFDLSTVQLSPWFSSNLREKVVNLAIGTARAWDMNVALNQTHNCDAHNEWS